MERVNKILKHPGFCYAMGEITRLEKDREFCLHGMEHSLAVGRMMYISALEEGLPYEKDIIYAGALLHDIGRSFGNSKEVSHGEAGLELAEKIMLDCGFLEGEISLVLEAMRSHGHDREEGLVVGSFSQLLSRCDRLSRNCFCCKVKSLCYWDDTKKNEGIYL